MKPFLMSFGVEIVCGILAVAFASFCIWLVVRVINRRERWTKRTVIAVGALVLYVFSWAPVAWLTSSPESPYPWPVVDYFFWPVWFLQQNAPEPVGNAMSWWSRQWPSRYPYGPEGPPPK